jgi:large subunit ribosomal protein L3
MSLGLIGTKQGMTRLFTPEGDSYAVSVVSVDPNTVTQIKLIQSMVITQYK